MKSIQYFSLLLVAAILIIATGCKKLPSTDTSNQDSQVSDLGEDKGIIEAAQLESLLPQEFSGYTKDKMVRSYSSSVNVPEVYSRYVSKQGSPVIISIADLANVPKLYKNFLSGGGIYQSSQGTNFGLQFSREPQQGSENYGLLLGQGSLGQASRGVLDMAQTSQAIVFQVSSQISPQISPQQSSQVSVILEQGSLDLGQASLSPDQVSNLLQESGVDFAQASNQFSFQISQSSSKDGGSFINPFSMDTGSDVAGWELYDSNSKVGVMLLGVSERVGILIEGANIQDISVLRNVAAQMDFKKLEEMVAKTSG